jgi:hypothetical protein
MVDWVEKPFLTLFDLTDMGVSFRNVTTRIFFRSSGLL